jgi:hypothetical protein
MMPRVSGICRITGTVKCAASAYDDSLFSSFSSRESKDSTPAPLHLHQSLHAASGVYIETKPKRNDTPTFV